MAFMKRALEKQRAEARQEAEKLMQALQEEEEFDEDAEEKTEPREESEQAKQIHEALSGGGVKRGKQKAKSLDVKENITAKPLFEAPAVPALFDDAPAATSHLLDDLDESEDGSSDHVADAYRRPLPPTVDRTPSCWRTPTCWRRTTRPLPPRRRTTQIPG